MYAKGKGVMQDDKKAYAWYSVAAKNGNESAASDLADITQLLAPELIVEAKALAHRYFNDYQSK